MTAFIDTNILVRHLTGDPPAMAERATAFLASQPELYLADLIVAETVYVLESFYKAPRDQVAVAMRSLIAMRSMITVDPALLLRAIEVYEVEQLDFAQAYLVACAESAGVGAIAQHCERTWRLRVDGRHGGLVMRCARSECRRR